MKDSLTCDLTVPTYSDNMADYQTRIKENEHAVAFTRKSMVLTKVMLIILSRSSP